MICRADANLNGLARNEAEGLRFLGVYKKVVEIVGVSGRHILCSIAIVFLLSSDENREFVVRAVSKRPGHPVRNGVKVFGVPRGHHRNVAQIGDNRRSAKRKRRHRRRRESPALLFPLG
jgi:hypothetical protein